MADGLFCVGYLDAVGGLAIEMALISFMSEQLHSFNLSAIKKYV